MSEIYKLISTENVNVIDFMELPQNGIRRNHPNVQNYISQ